MGNDAETVRLKAAIDGLPSRYCGGNTLHAPGCLAPGENTDELLAAMHHRNSRVRTWAVVRAGRLKLSAETVIHELVTALADPRATVGREAAVALQRRGRDTVLQLAWQHCWL